MIRVGLQILEDMRGELLDEESRSSWIRRQRELHASVFARLQSVRYNQRKAGELALWLLESLHRTLTKSLMRDEGLLESDGSLLAAVVQLAFQDGERERNEGGVNLGGGGGAESDAVRSLIRERLGELAESSFVAEPTDLADVLRRLGGRAALLYHCWRAEAEWLIHAVLVSPGHQIRLHTARLVAPADDSESFSLVKPGEALDALATGNPLAAALLFENPLADPLWEELSAVLVPPQWWDVVCPSDGRLVDLLVVPDGPIASLPLAVLPVRGRPLVEQCSIAMTPALGLLQAMEGSTRPAAGGLPVAVVHLNDADPNLPKTLVERERWNSVADTIAVFDTKTRVDLERALIGPPKPDVVAISVHGVAGESADMLGAAVVLRDESILTAAAALRLPWPPIVLLGACWVGAVKTSAGREPVGFPLACMLRGANVVIGGAVPIQDNRTAAILAQVISGLTTGSDVLGVVGAAQRTILDGMSLGAVRPVECAGLIAWTRAPGHGYVSAHSDTLSWTIDGTPVAAGSMGGGLSLDSPIRDEAPQIAVEGTDLGADRPVGPTHRERMAVVDGNMKRMQPSKRRGWFVPAIVAAVLLLLPPTSTLGAFIYVRTLIVGTGVLGAVLGPGEPPGAAIVTVIPGSPAAAAGLRVGDLITSIDGVSVRSAEIAVAILHVHPPGTRFPITVLRDGRETVVWVGLVGKLPLDNRSYMGIEMEGDPGNGALVTAVDESGPAATAGLRVGDVITAVAGAPTADSPAVTLALVESHHPGQVIRISILRHGQPGYIDAVVGEVKRPTG
jgi:hypothetical protein